MTDTKKTTLASKVEKTITKSYRLDLRIHRPESLGAVRTGGIEPASALVTLAKSKGLDVIAVTDFYSTSFLEQVLVAAKNSKLLVIPGVDIRVSGGTIDDLVLSCLFPEQEGVEAVRSFLTAIGMNADAQEDSTRKVQRSIAEIMALVDERGGLAIPSGIDKTPSGLRLLPDLVEKFGFRTFNLAYADSAAVFKKRWPKIKFHLTGFSNAKALAQVGVRYAKLKMKTPTFSEVKSLMGRQIEIEVVR